MNRFHHNDWPGGRSRGWLVLLVVRRVNRRLTRLAAVVGRDRCIGHRRLALFTLSYNLGPRRARDSEAQNDRRKVSIHGADYRCERPLSQWGMIHNVALRHSPPHDRLICEFFSADRTLGDRFFADLDSSTICVL